MTQAIETPAGMQLVCQQFAGCANPTLKAYDHPILGVIPICQRCIDRLGFTDDELLDCEVIDE